MTPAKRRELTIQVALQNRLAARYERLISNCLARAMRAAADAIARDQGTAGVEAAVEGLDDELRQIMVGMTTAAYRLFGDRTATQLGQKSRRARETKREVNLLEAFLQALLGYVNAYTAERITSISTTTRDLIFDLIEISLAADRTMAEVARDIRREAPRISAVRARTIARTEVHSAAMAGQMGMAEATELTLQKEWLTVEDERSRPEHVAANGQLVGQHDAFLVGGERLDYPGDPSGSAENIINCRCSMIFVPV